MYRTPPGEGEENFSSQNPPLRRRRSTVGPYQYPKAVFHPDDMPGEPKVRRASLYLNREQAPVKDPPARRRRPPQQTQPLEKETSNRMVAVKRPNPVRAPLPPAHHTHRIHQKRTLQEQLLNLSHNQAASIAIAICLIALITSSVIYAFSHFHSAATPSISTSSNRTGNTGVTTITHSGDPREIVIVPEDTDHPAPPVYAQSAYLLDADTGATLYAYQPFLRLPGMSTTKLMTAVLAVEHGNLNQQVTITSSIEHDIQQLSSDSSLFGMKQGETYSLRDLLYGLLLVSGNDAAVAIADAVSGSQANFVAMMNAKAQQLGLLDTHYVNPHGLLDPNQYTSARDLAILGQYAMNNPLVHQITGTQLYTIPQGGHHPTRYLVNDNQFLWWYPGVDGGKPGYDGASNFVQVISATRNHHHLIAVVMHTNNWWTDERDLLNWGFDDFNWISPYAVDLQHPIPFDNLWNFFTDDKKENTIPTADKGSYYIYSGYSIAGPIMAYFNAHGGLKQFGYPESMVTVSSNVAISQHFQQGTIQCNINTNTCIRL